MDIKSGSGLAASYAGERPTPLLSADKKHETKETFDDPLISDLAFSYRWTIWEQYENKDDKDYTKTMMKVAWFADIISFWRIWKKVSNQAELRPSLLPPFS